MGSGSSSLPGEITTIAAHHVVDTRLATSIVDTGIIPIVDILEAVARGIPKLAAMGYEALARLGEGDTLAPVTALQTAHVWGDRFVIERDVTLLRTAITSYGVR